MRKQIQTFHAMNPQELDKQHNEWFDQWSKENRAIDCEFHHYFFVSGTDATTKFSVMVVITWP